MRKYDVDDDLTVRLQRITVGAVMARVLVALWSELLLRTLFLAVFLLVSTSIQGQSVFTYAGGGTVDGRPATTISLNDPADIAVDPSGNLYITDTEKHQVKRLDTHTGLLTTIAGNGAKGYTGDGGLALAAAIDTPIGVAADGNGNAYIAATLDVSWDVIRRVDAITGVITTVAIVFNAALAHPIAVDLAANIYIATDRTIKRIDASTGIIATIAGDPNGPWGYAGDGGPATAAVFERRLGVEVDRAGNVFIADSTNYRVRKIDVATGIITTVAGNGSRSFSGDGGPATLAGVEPGDVAVDLLGNLYVVHGNKIRRVDAATGTITTIAGGGTTYFPGDGTPATAANISGESVAVDASRNIYILDSFFEVVYRVDAGTGLITLVAGISPTATRPNLSGDGGPATAAILAFEGPFMSSVLDERGLAVDSSGNLHIADTAHGRIRRVDATTGIIGTIATGGQWHGPPTVIAFDSANNLYFYDSYRQVQKLTASTGIISTFADINREIRGLAVDSSDNVYMSDYFYGRIHRVDSKTGAITTFAGGGAYDPYRPFDIGDGGPATKAYLHTPLGLAFDAENNLYIADWGNHAVRRVDTKGMITSVGAPATTPALKNLKPMAVAVDSAQRIHVADYWTNQIVRLDSVTGPLKPIAGVDLYPPQYFGDGGPATKAGFTYPGALAFDSSDTLYVSDTFSNRVRVIYPCIEITPPRQTSPSDQSSGVASAPRLTWTRVTGAFRYDVYLGVSPSLQTPAVADIAATSFSPSNLEPLTTYYWRIVAKGDPFCDPFRTAPSEVRSFTTASGCRRPAGFDGASP